MTRRHAPFVLAISPSPRGFAFVLFQGAERPFDWGVKRVAGDGKNFRIVQAITKIICDYRPDTIVLEDTGRRTRRGMRIRTLLRSIVLIADKKGIQVVRIKKGDVKATFARDEARTRPEVATAIAKRIPALAHRVPPQRKIWQSEDPRQSLFDAAALGITFYETMPAGS